MWSRGHEFEEEEGIWDDARPTARAMQRWVKMFWMGDVWNRCFQRHDLMDVLTASAYRLASILHFLALSHSFRVWPRVTVDCSVFVFNGNRLFESTLSHCSQRQ